MGAINSKKRTQLLETGRSLFFQHGVKRVSVEEICRQARVSKMTFYKYFINKTDLLQHIWDGMVEENFIRVDQISALDVPFPDKLQMILEYKLEVSASVGQAFLDDIFQLDLDLDVVKQRILRFIAEAQERGEVRSEVRPEFLLAAFDKLMELSLDEELVKKYEDPFDLYREGFNFFYYGILTRSG